MAKKVHTCRTCGSLVEEPGHLCNPEGEPMTCIYCGEDGSFARHYCQGKLKDIGYVCEQCDRLATSGKHLCKPSRVPRANLPKDTSTDKTTVRKIELAVISLESGERTTRK